MQFNANQCNLLRNIKTAGSSCITLQRNERQDVYCTGTGCAFPHTIPALIRLRLNDILLCETDYCSRNWDEGVAQETYLDPHAYKG